EVERELEPYGLVLKAGVWYLAARVEGGDFRVYRVDRFTATSPTSAGTNGHSRFDRLADFDLPAFWEERAAQFVRSLLREKVVLRLTEEGARRLPYATDRTAGQEAVAAAKAAEGAEGPDGQGRITVT
ncbi:helix-turn-helix transcriptional regulator, partial [Streptomyces sp. MCAF7]